MEELGRIRTIAKCAEYLKCLDSETAITQSYIRSLCNNNLVKHLMSGNKVLVSLDDLLLFLNFQKPNEIVESAVCM